MQVLSSVVSTMSIMIARSVTNSVGTMSIVRKISTLSAIK